MNPRTVHTTEQPAPPHPEHRVERLINRLPDRMQTTARWLRRPSSRWARLPAGLLLAVGGTLSFLPILGLWMLPLGLLLLAEDLAPLRKRRDNLLERIERHRPHWFTGAVGSAPGLSVLPSDLSTPAAGKLPAHLHH
jgi:hypothetical protein